MEEVKDAVKELEGPGSLLGYRAIHKKLRQEYNLVGRNLLSCEMMSQTTDF